MDAFITDVLNAFAHGNHDITPDVTDRIFLLIESDQRLSQRYDDLTPDAGARHALNSRLGRRIREHFGLRNIGCCNSPKSKLIKSYERHSPA